MRVLINGVSALKPKTGVGHTTQHLHQHLVRVDPESTFWLYPGEAIAGAARKLLAKPRPASGPSKNRSRMRAVRGQITELAKVAYRTHLAVASRWGNFNLYHEPNFVPIRTHLPTVVTVHDLSVVLYPQWHPRDRVRFHERHFADGIATAEHIIVVSDSVRREAIEVLGLAPDRVSAVRNGIDETYRPQSQSSVDAMRRRLNLPSRYCLAVGTIEPRKNIGMLLRAFCDLPATQREACPLVLAGGWGWKSDAERDYFNTVARWQGVIHLGYVADTDLSALYTGADALLFPSFYEGFGLPPLEMLACGGGVVASTAHAVREVVGRHAMLLDPHDFAGWRDALCAIAKDAGFLAESRRGGVAHARSFTWMRAAAETLAVYRRVLGIAQHQLPRPLSAAA